MSSVKMNKVQKLTTVSLLLALMIVGSMIKFFGSIALDSLAAFVGAALFGPVIGLFLGVAGHLLTAVISGFPLSLPVHLLVAAMMGVCLFVYGSVWRKERGRRLLADGLAYLINVPLASLFLMPLLGMSVWLLFVPLSLATLSNLILAEVVLSGLTMIKPVESRGRKF
ncbi:hypothetical protein IGI37_003252 [Enterococcus sp. AZ194]|uniref:ECF transporter S component n=1 Tax=Enterococcus sp. AZ194 TaxID=2774629 RepID=UPI003F292D13